MKRPFASSAALAGVALLLIPVLAEAQTAAQTVERAVMGAPARARADATVVKFNADHTWETLREGSNGWVCYDRSNEGRRPAFAVQCTNIENLPRIAQNRAPRRWSPRPRRTERVSPPCTAPCGWR